MDPQVSSYLKIKDNSNALSSTILVVDRDLVLWDYKDGAKLYDPILLYV
jgi:hypothetical protein